MLHLLHGRRYSKVPICVPYRLELVLHLLYCTLYSEVHIPYILELVIHLLPCVGVLYGSHTCSLTSRLLAVYHTGWSWTDTESLNPTSLYALDLLESTPCSLKLTCVAYE